MLVLVLVYSYKEPNRDQSTVHTHPSLARVRRNFVTDLVIVKRCEVCEVHLWRQSHREVR